MLYIVKYSGPFGFIKPCTAVRDEEVYSQQFLTPSIVGGLERKLFPDLLNKAWGIYKIKGHRLTYAQIAQQQEQTTQLIQNSLAYKLILPALKEEIRKAGAVRGVGFNN